MSQRIVERVLGRLITDEDFRKEFFEAPLKVCSEHQIEVTDDELQALIQMDQISLRAFAGCLDRKIVRASGGTLTAEQIGARARR